MDDKQQKTLNIGLLNWYIGLLLVKQNSHFENY